MNTETNPINVLTDSPGCICGKTDVHGNDVFISTVTEPITCVKGMMFDYNLHFCFGLENQTNVQQQVNIFINCTNNEVLPETAPMLYSTADLANNELEPFQSESRTDGVSRYSISINMEAHQRLFLSNTQWRRYDHILTRIQNSVLPARTEIIGQTIDGNDIAAYCYETGNIQDKPSILISSGYHPPEPDTLASIGIMEAMQDESNRRNILDNFNLYIIPVLNPDGFIHGLQGANRAGINYHWKFLGNTKQECPESHAVMEFCQRIKPVLYIDFHAYTFQLRNHASAYIKPSCFYAGKETRTLVKQLNQCVADLMSGHTHKSESVYIPTTLAYWLTSKFNTITYAKFHLHLKDGLTNFPAMGWTIVQKCTDILRANKVTSPDMVLKTPYGKVSRHDPCLLIARIIVAFYWNSPIRPAVAILKRLNILKTPKSRHKKP